MSFKTEIELKILKNLFNNLEKIPNLKDFKLIAFCKDIEEKEYENFIRKILFLKIKSIYLKIKKTHEKDKEKDKEKKDHNKKGENEENEENEKNEESEDSEDSEESEDREENEDSEISEEGEENYYSFDEIKKKFDVDAKEFHKILIYKFH